LLLRDKKVVGVFVRFRAPSSSNGNAGTENISPS
jgi:hypothetical protein